MTKHKSEFRNDFLRRRREKCQAACDKYRENHKEVFGTNYGDAYRQGHADAMSDEIIKELVRAARVIRDEYHDLERPMFAALVDAITAYDAAVGDGGEL